MLGRRVAEVNREKHDPERAENAEGDERPRQPNPNANRAINVGATAPPQRPKVHNILAPGRAERRGTSCATPAPCSDTPPLPGAEQEAYRHEQNQTIERQRNRVEPIRQEFRHRSTPRSWLNFHHAAVNA